jgi:rubrerythrin
MKYSFGELGAMDHLDTDALRSLYTIELGGRDFYGALAEGVENSEVASLFRRNGREEAGHARRLGRAIAIKQGHKFEPTPDMLDVAPVRLPGSVDGEFLGNLAIGEAQGDSGYQRWADHEPDEKVARLLRLNAREESIHGQRVLLAVSLLGLDRER